MDKEKKRNREIRWVWVQPDSHEYRFEGPSRAHKMFLGCLVSSIKQCVSQKLNCFDSFTCCCTDTETTDQTCYLTRSQYTETGTTSCSADHITWGIWQGSQQMSRLQVAGMTWPELRNRQKCQWNRATEDYNPSTDPVNVWQDMSKPCYSGCEQDTVACKRIRSELVSWTLHSAVAKKRNRRSTTSSRTVPSGGNRDTSYDCRMSQPPTSCRERRKTCAAPHNSWQHVDWGSKLGWSTAEEETWPGKRGVSLHGCHFSGGHQTTRPLRQWAHKTLSKSCNALLSY